ncbi:hypothetical protein GCM10025734_59430 [Kitasatospora paranensis]
METALKLSGGMVVLEFVDLPADDPERERMFSEHLYCPYDDVSFEELEPRSFSFNSPFGACPDCSGLGNRMEVDPELVIPDEEKSLEEGAIHPWSQGHTKEYFQRLIDALAGELGFRTDLPWAGLPARARKALLYGHKTQVEVKYRNRYGRERSYTTSFEGAVPFVQRRHSESESDSSRERFEGYMREVPCPACHGTRLKPVVLAVTIQDKSIADVSGMSISDCAEFLGAMKLTARDKKIAERVLKEVNERLRFLVDVGLDYLSLNRAAGTLSGGEAQRIRLATQIGSGLVGVLYVLDEPSIGLHQRDNHRLIETLVRLRDIGNTLIVVEHDEDTIKTADWIVDIGPGAGEHGGKVVHSGSLKELLANDESLTGQYLSGKRAIPTPAVRRPRDKKRQLTVHGAREHNLQDVTVGFPLGTFTAVTGVSGSGKSTLVNDILYTHLARELNGARSVPGRHTRITGTDLVDKVVHVDQSPIGRTPRSNPATYTGVFDHVRKLFAETQEAKVRGYLPGRFSFNVKGGRCENCSGDGTIKIEMNFLPDVYVPCEVCHGARYNRETLEVHYKGKSIAEVLDMPIEEGLDFFEAVPAIARHLRTLKEVGLGYVRLGQPATTLSGGEAQRVKLSSELQKRSTGRTVYVLDEPTTGLHFEDISKLIRVLEGLVDKGNTVIVIEHNLDVIKTADWIVDMGPEGGSGGGMVVAEGTPEEIAQETSSHTGKFLRDILGGVSDAADAAVPAARKGGARSGTAKAAGSTATPASGPRPRSSDPRGRPAGARPPRPRPGRAAHQRGVDCGRFARPPRPRSRRPCPRPCPRPSPRRAPRQRPTARRPPSPPAARCSAGPPRCSPQGAPSRSPAAPRPPPARAPARPVRPRAAPPRPAPSTSARPPTSRWAAARSTATRRSSSPSPPPASTRRSAPAARTPAASSTRSRTSRSTAPATAAASRSPTAPSRADRHPPRCPSTRWSSPTARSRSPRSEPPAAQQLKPATDGHRQSVR